MKAEESPASAGESDAVAASQPSDCTQKLRSTIIDYLKDVREFQELSEIRKKVRDTTGNLGCTNLLGRSLLHQLSSRTTNRDGTTRRGDRHFAQRRARADKRSNKQANYYRRLMEEIAKEMHKHTGVFKIKSSDSGEQGQFILDMCMAPGVFLKTALTENSGAQALAFSLDPADGGYNISLPEEQQGRVVAHLLDITMLAGDVGILPGEIPADHPDAGNFKFLPHFNNYKQGFDLAICDGQVLRTHPRPQHRDKGEPTRLILTQLIISLSHLKPGGAMIILGHKLEAPDSVQLLYTLNQFADVNLFKPIKSHGTRSSFYILATNVRSDSEDARMAIERWRRLWKLATFEFRMEDNEYEAAIREESLDIDRILEDFGSKYVDMGRSIWKTQADALKDAPWMKKA
ncbi:uncharacterized protein BDV17DRAFT_288227 [Aspergillus undulatus]|uniref:uncharacterized protein n=1 Tax=Aspergillus undulatus TaxID=1810928 RepID=UPI003CCCFE52